MRKKKKQEKKWFVGEIESDIISLGKDEKPT
jgi:hypothetical protein